jgi:ribonuclease P/MRP protein subunit RPP40
MSRRSCLSQLIESTNDWTQTLGDGGSVDVLYLDVAKAFNTVSHEKLLSKLAAMGVGGFALNWIKAFLSGRKQRVVLDGEFSEWADVKSGVPQGSVLGPLLFLVFINDLPSVVRHCVLKIFADDCKLYFRVDRLVDKDRLQADLERVYRWFDEWQLSLAVHKCFVLHLGSRNNELPYVINGQNVVAKNHDETAKDLGILVDPALKFSSQCKEACRKAACVAYQIRRTFSYRNRGFLASLFVTYARPRIEYISPVWSPFLISDIDRVERVQRRFTKYLSNLRDVSYSHRLEILAIEPLELRRIRTDLSLVYQIVYGLIDLKFDDFFKWSNDHRTRGSHGLKLQSKVGRAEFSLNARFHYFSNRVVRQWNFLPSGVVLAPTLHRFKSGLCSVDLSSFLRGSMFHT